LATFSASAVGFPENGFIRVGMGMLGIAGMRGMVGMLGMLGKATMGIDTLGTSAMDSFDGRYDRRLVPVC
jgi:hypothetical protein